MKMKNKVLMILSIVVIFMMASMFLIKSYADVDSAFLKGNFSGDMNGEAGTSINKITGTMVAAIRYVGSAIALIILMACAIKYITASAGDRASIKKYVINYSIGAIVLFGATNILGIIIKFVTGL